MMDMNRTSGGAAQPAEEELKKHGDQLAQPVKEAAGKTPQKRDKDVEKGGEESND
jgi:hypothetical protein